MEQSKNGVLEVKILNGHGFNFNVAPSLVQIVCLLIYQGSEVHGGTCENSREGVGVMEVWSKGLR